MKEQILKCGIDIDGVLRAFHERLREVYLKYNPKELVPEINNWNKDNLQTYFEKDIKIFYTKDSCQEVYSGANLLKDSLDFMYKLYRSNHITLVSNQPDKYTETLTLDWLLTKKVPYDDILITNNKGEFNGHFLLDDRTPELEKILISQNSVPVCFDRPWNKDWKGLRVKNYKEFLGMLERGCPLDYYDNFC